MSATERQAMLRAAVDAHGADFGRWPDPTMIGEARAALLADRGFRARWEAAASLDRAIEGARELASREAAKSGGPERILRALLAETARPRRWSPRAWAAIAAALVLAAGLGSFIDFTVIGRDQSYDVVTIDPLVFGTAGTEAQ